jgi:hypothetical protein
LKKDYQPRTNIVKDEKGDLVRLPQYGLGGETICLRCSVYMGLMMLGIQKYVQLNYYCLNEVPLRMRWLLKC